MGNNITTAHRAILKKYLFGDTSEIKLGAKDKIQSFCTGNKSDVDSQLFLALGKDILPTLIALWSLKPKKAYFFYTPNDRVVKGYMAAMLAHKELLPVEEITFVPSGLAGLEMLRLPFESKSPVDVNITPGTKGQSFALSLFSRLHEGRIFSIHSVSKTVAQIPTGAKYPLCGPEPATFLKLSGFNIKSDDVPKGDLNQPEEKNKNEEAMNKIRISISRGKVGVPGNLKTNWGENFEMLVGHAILSSGADDVRVRIRTKWSGKTQEHLEKKHKKDTHMTDVDVVARFGGDYFVISCKGGGGAKQRETAKELKAVKNIFGRFAVPLVAWFNHADGPKKVDDVYLFGHKTLSNYEALKELLQRALKENRTTDETT